MLQVQQRSDAAHNSRMKTEAKRVIHFLVRAPSCPFDWLQNRIHVRVLQVTHTDTLHMRDKPQQGGRATRPTCMHEEGVTSDHKQASLVLLLAGLLLLVLLQLVGPAAPVTAGGGVGMMEPPEQAHQQQREQSQASGGCCTPASASSDSSVPVSGWWNAI